MTILWDDSWNTGIAVIDQQHRKLLNLVNDLGDAMRAGKSKDVLEDVLTLLVNYTKTHFAQEEGLMSRASYAGLEKHKQQHADFILKIDDYEKRVKSGSSLVSIDMMRFLSNWLIQHIKGTDQQYVPALCGKSNP